MKPTFGSEALRVSKFENRSHFFAAAAEARRRILVDNARRHGQLKCGGNQERGVLRDPNRSWCDGTINVVNNFTEQDRAAVSRLEPETQGRQQEGGARKGHPSHLLAPMTRTEVAHQVGERSGLWLAGKRPWLVLWRYSSEGSWDARGGLEHLSRAGFQRRVSSCHIDHWFPESTAAKG